MSIRLGAGLAVVVFAACSNDTGFQNLDKTPSDPSDTGVSTTTHTTPPADPEEPVADAGPDLGVVAGDEAILDGSNSYDPAGGPLTYAWQLLKAPAGSVATLTALDTKKVAFTADVAGTYKFQLGVQNQAGVWDSTPDEALIVADPAPPVADAGPDATFKPLDTVPLDGSASSDPGGFTPLTYSWTMVSKPTNSTAVLDDPTAKKPTFLADLAGEYVCELNVTNTQGVSDPTPDQVTITTTPADGFYVELSWPTVGDLDLHLLNSQATRIFDCPNDCNYDRPNPNWGAAGNLDDPSLDEDTIPGVSGVGPEIITIDDPADDTYTVLVHYYGQNAKAQCPADCPDSDATVNIYLGGALAASFTRTMLEDDDVWTVASIVWPSGLITPIDTMGANTHTVCY